MAKTLMISNEVYIELKKIKGDTSFSELLRELIETKSSLNSGRSIKKFFGALRSDREYDNITKSLNGKWKEWHKKYA